ncbi:TrbC family F-type conjugative pilus assembly protein [Thorsellia kenyensis]|uniref:TrbC family F-type conjugative pilus assembly protein n=1 Tax=Thorsellia kenyensis TaxID=1549888 RepID=A0ABV6CIC9_9GAMM
MKIGLLMALHVIVVLCFSSLFFVMGKAPEENRQADNLGLRTDNKTSQVGINECDFEQNINYKIMISKNLSLNMLKQLMQEALQYDAQLIIRGITQDSTLSETVNFWHGLFINMKEIPNLIISPQLFTQNTIVSVPALVAFYANKPIAKVTGISNIGWLKDKLNASFGLNHQHTLQENCEAFFDGRVLDFGHQGSTVEISEIDMLDLILAKISTIDWSLKQENAVYRYWHSLPSFALEKASECKIKQIDATVKISQPLFNHLGEVIIPAGTRLNPFDYIPFTQQIIVFNGTHDDEVQMIQNYLRDHQHNVTLITSTISQTNPRDQFQTLQKRFEQPLFLLNDTLITRFSITHTPSVISGHNSFFVVKEGCLDKS